LIARNPFGLVPIIEYKDHVVYESSICDELLEDLFPQPPLMPNCPFERAKHRLVMQAFDKDITAVYGMLSRHEEKRQKSAVRFESLLKRCEQLLKENNTTYLTGDNVMMVDFHFWPWFERLPAFTELRGSAFLPFNEFPRLNKWINSMSNIDTVKKTRMPNNWHLQFILSLAQKDPQYDIGLQFASQL